MADQADQGPPDRLGSLGGPKKKFAPKLKKKKKKKSTNTKALLPRLASENKRGRGRGRGRGRRGRGRGRGRGRRNELITGPVSGPFARMQGVVKGERATMLGGREVTHLSQGAGMGSHGNFQHFDGGGGGGGGGRGGYSGKGGAGSSVLGSQYVYDDVKDINVYQPTVLPLTAAPLGAPPGFLKDRSGVPLAEDEPFCIQFPSCMPFNRTEVMNAREQAHLRKSQAVKVEGEAAPPEGATNAWKTIAPCCEATPCLQHSCIPSGFVGKLVVLKSGKMKLLLGSSQLDVEISPAAPIQQQLLAVNLPGKQAHVLGDIHRKMVLTPDIPALLKKKEGGAGNSTTGASTEPAAMV